MRNHLNSHKTLDEKRKESNDKQRIRRKREGRELETRLLKEVKIFDDIDKLVEHLASKVK